MSEQRITKMTDIQLVVKRKELQGMLDENNPNVPREVVESYLGAIISEMNSRVQKL